ncbi:hypothetical protein LXA43DRAFT_1148079 [Ganoderma leucocontextum]|nr:hypothetical protein LXA43DRAFT_1148079 [Ganoderma leucocontextum]
MVRPLPFATVLAASDEDWDTLYNSSGAVLLGGLVALLESPAYWMVIDVVSSSSSLSGSVFMQVVLYWRLYTSDPIRTKSMVIFIWVLDLVHSMMVCIANWENLIANFGGFDNLDYITWSIAVTVALTALTTFTVHCFFSHRIHTLSRRNWYITVPLVTLASVRLIAAVVSTTEMIRLRSFEGFVKYYGYVFTLGLSTSTVLDILITGILCLYLRRRRSGMAKMDRIISVLTLYTVENGMLTCDQQALNARKSLSSRLESLSGNSEGFPMPVMFPTVHYSPRSPTTPWPPHASPTSDPTKSLQVNIDIEHTIHREASLAQPHEGDCGQRMETSSEVSGDEKLV